MNGQVFRGCIPALMTPCTNERTPNYDALVSKAQELTTLGMNAVVYCGSMGDWPLLTNEQRMEGVSRLVKAGVEVIVGTGAQNTAIAVEHAAHSATTLPTFYQQPRNYLLSFTTVPTTDSKRKPNCSLICEQNFRTLSDSKNLAEPTPSAMQANKSLTPKTKLC
jgi:hypothetical protein